MVFLTNAFSPRMLKRNVTANILKVPLDVFTEALHKEISRGRPVGYSLTKMDAVMFALSKLKLPLHEWESVDANTKIDIGDIVFSIYKDTDKNFFEYYIISIDYPQVGNYK